MASTHRKLRRKDLKQPDEFTTLVEASQQYLTTHLGEILAGAAVIAAAIAVVFGIRLYQQHRAATAANEFYQAFTALDAKKYKDAEQGFLKLSHDAPGLQVGRLARFYLGTCYLEQNELAPARDAFHDYLAGEHDPMFGSLAMVNLGVVYERLGNLPQAELSYRQAAATPGPEQLRAQLAVARILGREGKTQAAVDQYRRFLNEHPFAPERQEAMEAIAELGASPVAAAPVSASTPAAGH
ncbi:MAG TPA: tetratricopeptide repeat protein [Candidatus Binataceae bacterium]|nr:tetratricopeptide repeat protein [Candidatus Binataceae bacterium]